LNVIVQPSVDVDVDVYVVCSVLCIWYGVWFVCMNVRVLVYVRVLYACSMNVSESCKCMYSVCICNVLYFRLDLNFTQHENGQRENSSNMKAVNVRIKYYEIWVTLCLYMYMYWKDVRILIECYNLEFKKIYIYVQCYFKLEWYERWVTLWLYVYVFRFNIKNVRILIGCL